MLKSDTVQRPLLPVAFSILSGIGLSAFAPGFSRTAAVCGFAAAVWLLVLVVRRRSARIVPLFFCLSAGYLSLQPWVSPALPADHILNFADHGRWRIQGVVADVPKKAPGANRWRWIMTAEQIANKTQQLQVGGKVQVTARGLDFRPRRGDRLNVSGRLRSVGNFNNPGGFDYKRFLGLQGIFCRVYARADHIERTGQATRPGWVCRLELFRDRLARCMDDALAGRSTDCRAVLKALVLGERDLITPDLREAFNRSGVGHLLAISGLHIGMVAAFVYVSVRWLLTWIPWVTARAWSARAACLITLLPVLFYALVAGLTPSTQRAVLMVMVMLVCTFIGRGNDLLNAAALAALVILAASPPTVLGVSFQLSFCAVVAIVVGIENRVDGRAVETRWQLVNSIGLKVMNLLMVSFLAIAGTLPLTLYYFNQLSFVGLGMNLLVVPLAGTLVVPLGLLGAIFSVFSSMMAAFCWWGAAWGIDLVLFFVSTASQWPWAAVKTITPSILEIFLYYALFFLLLVRKKCRFFLAALCLVAALACLDIGYWVHRRFFRQSLSATSLDVGQGSAAVLELPGGYTVLVDGGGFSDPAAFDVGRYIVAPFLWRNKIRSVDLVVLSHPNSDHLNGLLYILQQCNVGEVWSNHEKAPTYGYRRWMALIEAGNIDHARFEDLDRRVIRNGVALEVLAPPADFSSRTATEPWRDLNNNSLVLRVAFKDVVLLFTGDIARPAELAIVQDMAAGNLSSTVLFVPHHGSRGSSCLPFLKAVSPREAIISAGYDNIFGFPHPEVLDRLTAVRSRVWRTDKHGAIRIDTDGRTYRVSSFLDCRQD